MRRQDGFTLIEVIVGMLVSTLLVVGVSAALINASSSSLSSQRQANLVEIAQAQIDKVHQIVSQYGFAALALNASPANPTDATLPASPNDPNDFVVANTSFLIENNYNATSHGQISAAPANGEPLEVDTTNGRVTPKVSSIAAGGATVTIWTFVTKAAIGCNSAVLGACAADDARRVIVAAKLNTIAGGRQTLGPNTPVYLSTVIANPVPSNQSNSSTGIRIGLNLG
jgi:prepilin-type N-terminal cleavage/methylation domain-containing protein